jgi:hypothetical protein
LIHFTRGRAKNACDYTENARDDFSAFTKLLSPTSRRKKICDLKTYTFRPFNLARNGGIPARWFTLDNGFKNEAVPIKRFENVDTQLVSENLRGSLNKHREKADLPDRRLKGVLA